MQKKSVFTTALATSVFLALMSYAPAIAQDADARMYAGLQSAFDETQKVVQRVCPLAPNISTHPIFVKFGEGTADIATTAQGQIALTVLRSGDSHVLIFPAGIQSTPTSLAIDGALVDGSLKLSRDGHFVTWLDAFGPFHVYDLSEKKLLEVKGVENPCSNQWIGNELWVHDCRRQVVIAFHQTDRGFELFRTIDDKLPSTGREAISDQLGESFMRGPEVFTSLAAVEAAGAVVTSPIGSERAPLRVGSELFLLRLTDHGPASAEENRMIDFSSEDAVPKLVRVSDGKTIDLHNRACLPLSMASSPTGAKFAVLQGSSLAQIFDAKTMKPVSSFKLDARFSNAPRRIAFETESVLLVMTNTGVVRYSLP